ncbi:hypothetical protein DFH06DRAFT_1485948 [Mycena polygramma]|nr:hypothetical protein DFH06DRAFT_1485948 [Mycena polygramma]
MDQDPEQPPVDHDKDDPTHDAAAAPMWAVYVSEAEKYDRSLVESWKSDMEGMLIFAGLFSASLTAFLIESYKTLTPDSGDAMAIALTQISLQLAASANGTIYHVPPPTPFTPPATSLICNILWFISLGLSLTCALIATLLEQWARDFLHRANMRSAPVIRARVFSFLYYGLKRFRMHTVVEIIPLLLHASLLLFFMGLVAFLIPVNIVMTIVVGTILLTVTAVYSLLTLLPLLHLDCPYRTPLSSGFWRLRQKLRRTLDRWHQRERDDGDDSMVESVLRKAMQSSDERSTRDQNALSWTLKSLADDNELEPFIEAIPDVLWAPHRPSDEESWHGVHALDLDRRYVYDDLMRRLIDDPHVEFRRRLQSFGDTCSRGLLKPEIRTRRKIAFYKALWALSSLSTPGQSGSLISMEDQQDSDVRFYRCSAFSMQSWANLRAAQHLLDETSRYLMACRTEISAGRSPNFRVASTFLTSLHSEYRLLYPPPRPNESPLSLHQIEDIIEQIRVLPLTIYLNYLQRCGQSESKPYHFETTLSLVAPSVNITPSRSSIRTVTEILRSMVHTHSKLFRTAEEIHWLDEMFGTILSQIELLDSDDEKDGRGPVTSWPSVIDYLNIRKSAHAVSLVVSMLLPRGWKGVAKMFYHVHIVKHYRPLNDCLTALWTIFSCNISTGRENSTTLKEILQSVSTTKLPSITPSVMAMAKQSFLVALPSKSRHPPFADTFLLNPILRTTEEQTGEHPDEDTSPHDRWNQALQTITEFIECCCSIDLPYKAADTIRHIGNFCPEAIRPVRAVHQLRFATSVLKLCEMAVDFTAQDTVVQEIVNLEWFDDSGSVYGPGIAPLPSWLTDSAACNTLKAAFSIYIRKISAPGDDANLVQRVQRLITTLDSSSQEAEERSQESAHGSNAGEPDNGHQESSPNEIQDNQ